MPNTLAHPPSEIAQWCLVQLGLGTNPENGGSWPIFSDNEPDRPDNCITVFDTTGIDDGRVMHGEIQEHFGLQVRVRSATKTVGWTKADAIRKIMAETALLEEVAVPDESARYVVHAFYRVAPLIRLPNRPTERRHVHVFNLLTTIRQTAS